jgi:hypothetical protein
MKYLVCMLTTLAAAACWAQPAQASVIVNAPRSLGLTNGLVGWWTFDGKDISGVQAYDRSGNGNRGILTSGPVQTIGKLGQGLEFDGVDDRVAVADNDAYSISTTNKLSISMWIKASAFINGDSIIGKYCGAGNREFQLRTLSNGTLFPITFQSDGSTYMQTTSHTVTLEVGQWHHVVMIADHDLPLLALYVDTQLDGADTSAVGTFNGNGTCALDIGQANTGFFNGLIDDVRIYDHVLSADEIKRLYNLGGTVKLNSSLNTNSDSLSKGLVGWWTFDGKDMAGNYAFDRSGNGNRGTLTGSNGLPVRTLGKIGQGMQFDGVDDYVNAGDINAIDGVNEITVSAWVNTNTLDGGDANLRYVASKEGGSAAESPFILRMNTSTDKLDFRVGGASGYSSAIVTSAISPNIWYHVVGRYDGSTVRIYLNGVEQAFTSESDAVGTGSDPAIIANWSITSARGWSGLIDDVRIYSRALSKDEIKRLYNMGR